MKPHVSPAHLLTILRTFDNLFKVGKTLGYGGRARMQAPVVGARIAERGIEAACVVGDTVAPSGR